MSIAIGLAIWGYKGWLGELFPDDARARDFLSLYGQRFSCVEGNTTFYATPTIATVQRWAAQVPREFKFCPKLPQSVTHNGLLLPQLRSSLAFLDLMQHWGDRLGPLFLQLPPRYSPQQFDDLNQFLQGWTAATDIPLAVEVRHIDWFRSPHQQRLTAVLEDLQVGRVILDTRPIYPAPRVGAPIEAEPSRKSLVPNGEKKPNLPVQPTLTSHFSLVRFISHPERDANLIYWQEWVDRLRQWLDQGIEIYFFMHCPIEEHSPANARHFHAMLTGSGLAVPPLPWHSIAPPPSQLELF